MQPVQRRELFVGDTVRRLPIRFIRGLLIIGGLQLLVGQQHNLMIAADLILVITICCRR